ncbi:MAG: HAD family phosphatase [Candidatus Hydrogenedentes bacterium]|nr:HAD family phosphatase [Candidatus Hydrogenedentota bacterium]
MSFKWIITDIDGCLSPEESEPWDLDLFWELARLCRAAANGNGPIPPVTLCTGRPQPYVEVLAKILDVRLPIIAENGAVLYSLHDNWSRFGPGVTLDKVHGLRVIREYLDSVLLPRYPGALYQFGKEAMLSVYAEQPGVFAEMETAIQALVKERQLPEPVINATSYYLNISMSGVNKGTTLAALMAEHGVTRDEAVGVGDSVGDMPLRDAVGFFACPANAQDAIKAVADYVSPGNDVAGLLDILRLPQIMRR